MIGGFKGEFHYSFGLAYHSFRSCWGEELVSATVGGESGLAENQDVLSYFV